MAEQEAQKESQWYPKGEPQGKKGALWEQGNSGDVLVKRVKERPKKAEKATKEKNASEQAETKASPLEGIRGEATTEANTWRAPVTEPMKIDEDVLEESRQVVGAYADVVKDEDLQISVGPELHIADEKSSPLSSSPEPSELGVGMKFQWGF